LSSFVVYIDESGDEGFNFSNNASSEWFVVAAVITRSENDLIVTKLIERVRTKILWQRSQEPNLHFRKLRDRDKLLLLEEIATADLRAIAVMIHKPSITNRSAFNQKNVLYHYAARYLLERVSWCCRDWAANGVNGDGTAEVHFSNRANLKMQEFQSYLERLRFQSDNRID